MKITKLMSPNVVTIDIDDKLSVIKSIFDNTNFHHLLVVSGTQLVGVISDRDLLKALSPRIDTAAETLKDLNCLNQKAHQIMSREVIYRETDTTIKQAVEIFNTHKISCIPVVNSDKQPIGILTWRDIMEALGNNLKKNQTTK